MLLQIRLRIPDHPGSLGRVARTLGAAGADIVQVTVLEREAGRAVDDITVQCAGAEIVDRLAEALRTVPGLDLDGIWRTSAVPGATPDVEVLGQVAADPANGLAILVDAAPGIFSADWAALVQLSGRRRVVHASWQAPDPVDVSVVTATRLHATTVDGGPHLAVAPVGGPDLLLVVARQDAPPFHRVETSRLGVLAGVTATMRADQVVAGTLRGTPRPGDSRVYGSGLAASSAATVRPVREPLTWRRRA
jgi:hypothetical protein